MLAGAAGDVVYERLATTSPAGDVTASAQAAVKWLLRRAWLQRSR
ncbi:MAG: hypothetical protein ACYDEN_10820 [Acidimicrobiales bacterium]